MFAHSSRRRRAEAMEATAGVRAAPVGQAQPQRHRHHRDRRCRPRRRGRGPHPGQHGHGHGHRPRDPPAPAGRGGRRAVRAGHPAGGGAGRLRRAARPSRSPPIVGVGGVATGEHAVELLLAGADAVQVGTATFADPRAPAQDPRRAATLVPAPGSRQGRRSARSGAWNSVIGLVLALDVDDLVAALRLADQLRPWFGVAKVGPRAVHRRRPRRGDVGGRRRLQGLPRPQAARHPHHGREGGAGGRAPWARRTSRSTPGPARSCCGPGSRACARGRRPAGCPSPPPSPSPSSPATPTPPPTSSAGGWRRRWRRAAAGWSCAADDVHEAKQLAPRLLAVVPGIRLPSGNTHDQARAASPRQALEAGADMLVVGPGRHRRRRPPGRRRRPVRLAAPDRAGARLAPRHRCRLSR